MGYAASDAMEAAEIPVVDVTTFVHGAAAGSETAARDVARAMRRAAEDVGFFYIAGHGVPDEVLRRARDEALLFFRQPADRKHTVAINEAHHGFLEVGEARMRDAEAVDLKESFVWGLEGAAQDSANPFVGHNRWPEDRPAFREALTDFFEETSRCGVALMRAFAAAMDLPLDTFVGRVNRPISRGTCIYYPPQSPSMGASQFGVAPHTDYGCLTLLWQDEPGLEVRHRDGRWVTAGPIPETLVVNVGDLLARWTNDAFRSTEHRVINRTRGERLALALFWDPDYDTVVDPATVLADGGVPRYSPVACGSYIQERYDGSFSYRQPNRPPGGHA